MSADSAGAAIVETSPLQMAPPTRDPLTTTTSIKVDWQALSLANSGYS